MHRGFAAVPYQGPNEGGQRLPGVGPALAERIIAKLRRKVPKFALLVAREEAFAKAAAEPAK